VLVGAAARPEVGRSGTASRRPRRRMKRKASISSGWGTDSAIGLDGRRRRRAGVRRRGAAAAGALDADARSSRGGEIFPRRRLRKREVVTCSVLLALKAR
jgi:hypothetical protein